MEFKQSPLFEISIDTDVSGMVSLAGLHDSEIFHLSVEGNGWPRNLVMKARAENGFEFVFECINVGVVKIDGFSSQNVISEVEYFKGIDAMQRLESMKHLFHDQSEAHLASINTQILSGEKSLLYVLPSVGCEVFLLAAEVKLYQVKI